jgi:hypothetical protein
MWRVDDRLCRNVMDVQKVDIRSVIVLKEDVKLVENQPIDVTNVVPVYTPLSPFPSFEIDVDCTAVASVGDVEML